MKIYQVDAFSDVVFRGNPAAVCPLENSWLSDTEMQNIAAENNLSETAFFIRSENEIELRWFTPKAEVDLCGHATLATAHVLFDHENYKGDTISFKTKSGILRVTNKEGNYTLDFPRDSLQQVSKNNELRDCFNVEPIEIYEGKTDYMFVFKDQMEIETLNADLVKISQLHVRGIIVTAPGKEYDFVSRFFAPKYGVNEDPVTGSAHTTLVPYWSDKLNKNNLRAIQLSERQGILTCENDGDRIKLTGKAKTYLVGNIFI